MSLILVDEAGAGLQPQTGQIFLRWAAYHRSTKTRKNGISGAAGQEIARRAMLWQHGPALPEVCVSIPSRGFVLF